MRALARGWEPGPCLMSETATRYETRSPGDIKGHRRARQALDEWLRSHSLLSLNRYPGEPGDQPDSFPARPLTPKDGSEQRAPVKPRTSLRGRIKSPKSQSHKHCRSV